MLSIGYYCVVSVTIGDQSVRTLIKTLIISKYFVGSGANPVHTHVVVKSLIGCTVYYLKKMFTTPHLDSHSTTDPKPEILSAVLTGNRISHDGRNVRGIMHVHVYRKDDIFRKRRLNQ